MPPANLDASDAHRKIEELLQLFAGGSVQDLGLGGREAVLLEIFAMCGFNLRRSVILKNNEESLEVDGDFYANFEEKSQRIAIEVRGSVQPLSLERAIRHARDIRFLGKYDRAIIVAAGNIPEGVRRSAESDGLGYLDLLGLPELRSWLWKHAPTLKPQKDYSDPTCAQIIREAMKAIAARLVQAPEEIGMIHWRDMERVLREVFEGMGFDTTLTRGAKDGGFDLELLTGTPRDRQTYLVEVKHWSDQKPGKTNLRKLVRVTAKQKATLGILLSSSGFAPSIYEGLTKAERDTVALGGKSKIIALCSTYYRLNQQIWTPETSLSEQLLMGLI